jgi:hypothetical protein
MRIIDSCLSRFPFRIIYILNKFVWLDFQHDFFVGWRRLVVFIKMSFCNKNRQQSQLFLNNFYIIKFLFFFPPERFLFPYPRWLFCHFHKSVSEEFYFSLFVCSQKIKFESMFKQIKWNLIKISENVTDFVELFKFWNCNWNCVKINFSEIHLNFADFINVGFG